MPEITGISHFDLTVTDLDASETYYSKLLGMNRVLEGDDDEQGISVRYLMEPGSGTILGLVQHTEGSREPFTPRVIGLDHLAFAVEDREALKQWVGQLGELGIATTGVNEQPVGASVEFRDPDNIAVEFYVLGAAEQ